MTTETDLLPLPKASKMYDIPGYDEEELKDYARANVAHATAPLQAEVEALRAERDALEKDAAKYRWGINNARWIRSEQEAYVAIPVARDADLSCVAMRDAAIDQARGKGGKEAGND